MKFWNTFFFLFFAIGIFLTPSKSHAGNSGLAVVLVDMQDGFYRRGGVIGTQGLNDLVAKQQVLLKWAVANDIPVLVFEYQNFGKTDPKLMNLLKNHPHIVVEKQNDNGFTTPSKAIAVEALKKWDVDTLIMAGINGCCCVKGSALGGIESGFDVMTSSDVVGNINQNPPLYPNDTWYFKDKKFVVFENLDRIIK